MNLTVLTANLPRHLRLLHALSIAGHEVHSVIEPKSLGYRGDSGILRAYWARVSAAEAKVFGRPLMPTHAVVVPRGELDETLIDWDWTEQVVVFSSSYLKGRLIDRLEWRALNLHVGIAPEYRGSAPNMWAHYDKRDDLIGAQVQFLSRKLDAGPILAEVRPPEEPDYFLRGMLAVRAGIEAVVHLLNTPRLGTRSTPPWTDVRPNDPEKQLRYSTHADFTEDVATEILTR